MNALFFGRCNSEVVQLTNCGYLSLSEAAKYRQMTDTLPVIHERIVIACGGGLPTEYAYAVGKCECGRYHFAERRIERPERSSNHKCDGRCMNSKGRRCECSCKGKNHGSN